MCPPWVAPCPQMPCLHGVQGWKVSLPHGFRIELGLALEAARSWGCTSGLMQGCCQGCHLCLGFHRISVMLINRPHTLSSHLFEGRTKLRYKATFSKPQPKGTPLFQQVQAQALGKIKMAGNICTPRGLPLRGVGEGIVLGRGSDHRGQLSSNSRILLAFQRRWGLEQTRPVASERHHVVLTIHKALSEMQPPVALASAHAMGFTDEEHDGGERQA